MSLKNEAALLPISAIACTNGYHFVGAGTFLRLIDNTCCVLAEIQAFKSEAIHGIIIDDRPQWNGAILLLLWGAKRVRLAHATLGNGKSKISLGPEIVAPDYILDACFDTAEDNLRRRREEAFVDESIRAAIVTAHCSLLEVDWKYARSNQLHTACSSHGTFTKGPSSTQPSLIKLTSASRCILYSANVVWLSKTRILVAAGTVFGQIIVWSCNVTKRLITGDANTLSYEVFTGHEGSIFGVRISSPIAIIPGQAPRRLLASCSDDRTIRVWQIANMDFSESSMTFQDVINHSQHNDTGFIGLPVDSFESTPMRNSQIAWAWGHASRIWNVHFCPVRSSAESSDLISRLVSVGEDATCQFWDLLRTGTRELTLHHVRSSEHHSGKNIWSSVLSKQANEGTQVVTGGADGSIILHDLTGPDEQLLNVHDNWTIGDILQNMKTNSLCNPSSVSYDRGFDRTMEMSTFINGESECAMCDSQPGVQSSHQVISSLDLDDVFREYAFTRSDAFITTTKAGTLLLCSPKARDSPRFSGIADAGGLERWLRVGNLDDFRNKSILSKSCTPVPPICAYISGGSGTIYRYDNSQNSIHEVVKVDGKVSGLFSDSIEFSGKDIKVNCNVLSLTVATGGGKCLHNFISQGDECDMRPSHVTLQLPPGFITTTIKHVRINAQRELLFAGSRSGGIAVYSIQRLPQTNGSGTSELPHTEHFLPVLKLEKCHGKEAVTSFLWIPIIYGGIGLAVTNNSGHLFSTGRDGTYCIHRLDIQHDSIVSLLIHKSTLPFGPYIEGLHINSKNPETGHLLIWGFRNKHFILWDESAQEEVMSVECGGVHRNWIFQPSSQGQGGMFVWTRANVCNIYRQQHTLHRRIQQGGHGREIKAVAAAPIVLQVGSEKKHIVATGAEDTDICLFEYDPAACRDLAGKGAFHCLRKLRKHNTGIQHLQWSTDGKYVFSSGGFEEFFVWRIRSAPVVGFAVLCESTLPFQSEIPDLRITRFDIWQFHDEQPTVDGPEFVTFDIACAYSDSTVRLYRYQSSNGDVGWRHLHTGTYGPSHVCLTQSIFLSSSAFLLTAGGDGYVALWDTGIASSTVLDSRDSSGVGSKSSPWTYKSRFKIHQSSVKALDHQQLDNDTILLATGGDDNALGISLIQTRTQEVGQSPDYPNIVTTSSDMKHGWKSLSTMRIPHAHTAAINAVTIIHLNSMSTGSSKSNMRTMWVITSGNDQRLKLWKLSIDLGLPNIQGVLVKKVANVNTGVADLADIATLPSFGAKNVDPGQDDDIQLSQYEEVTGSRIVVCGVGMEVWKL